MSTIIWEREPINRKRLEFQDVMLEKRLCTCNWPEEAAKIYMKYLEEHPEDRDIVKMRVDEHEEEEDYYGNGGGIRRRLIIYKIVEETDEQYLKRIELAEDRLLEEYNIYTKALDEDYSFYKYGNKFN